MNKTTLFNFVLPYIFIVTLLVVCSTRVGDSKTVKVCTGNLVFGTIFNEDGSSTMFVMNDTIKYSIPKEELYILKSKQDAGIDTCVCLQKINQ